MNPAFFSHDAFTGLLLQKLYEDFNKTFSGLQRRRNVFFVRELEGNEQCGTAGIGALIL